MSVPSVPGVGFKTGLLYQGLFSSGSIKLITRRLKMAEKPLFLVQRRPTHNPTSVFLVGAPATFHGLARGPKEAEGEEAQGPGRPPFLGSI